MAKAEYVGWVSVVCIGLNNAHPVRPESAAKPIRYEPRATGVDGWSLEFMDTRPISSEVNRRFYS